MDGYLQVVRRDLKDLKSIQVKQIPWSQNSNADALTSLATNEGIEEFDSIPVERISQPANDLIKATLMVIDPEPTWIDKIIPHLKMRACLDNVVEARKLRIRAAKYTLIDNILYKLGYSISLLRCLNEK